MIGSLKSVRSYRAACLAPLAMLGLAMLVAACGSSTAKSAATQSTSASDRGGGGGTPGGGRFRNRTLPPDLQTSIAQGTPPPFGNRTPQPDVQTAIAQGTPASALRGGFGGGGGARVITALAGILALDEAQLRTELQAPGASIEKVALAHGIDRPTLRQRLIDAVRLSLNDAVKNGMLSQAMADQNASQFEANIDNTIDRVGGGGILDRQGGGAAGDATPGQ